MALNYYENGIKHTNLLVVCLGPLKLSLQANVCAIAVRLRVAVFAATKLGFSLGTFLSWVCQNKHAEISRGAKELSRISFSWFRAPKRRPTLVYMLQNEAGGIHTQISYWLWARSDWPTAILIITEGQFQVFQRFYNSKLVLKTVKSHFVALNYYENGRVHIEKVRSWFWASGLTYTLRRCLHRKEVLCG